MYKVDKILIYNIKLIFMNITQKKCSMPLVMRKIRKRKPIRKETKQFLLSLIFLV